MRRVTRQALLGGALVVSLLVGAHTVYAVDQPQGAKSWHIWTDVTGKFTRTGTLIEIRDGQVWLRQPSGRRSAIAWEKLNTADQQYAVELTAEFARAKQPMAPEEMAPQEIAAPVNTNSRTAPTRFAADPSTPGASDRSAMARTEAPPRASAVEENPAAEHTSTQPASRLSTLVQLVSGPLALLPTWEQQSAPARVIHLQVSRRYLEHFVNQDYHTVEGVSDYIAGSPVSGTSWLNGRSTIALVPSEKQAVADFFFVGSARANTVSNGGRAQISSVSDTSFQARKRVVLGPRGLELLPAASNASSSTSTCGICTSLPGLRGAIARRVTARRAEESQGQANYETARHFEAGINRGMDRDVPAAVAELDRFQRRFFAASWNAGLKLHSRASTTADRLDIGIFRRPPDANEAAVPPAIAGDPPAALWIHNSFLQQVLTDEPLRNALQPLVASFVEQGPSPNVVRSDAPVVSPSDWKVGWTQDGSWLTVSFDLPGKPTPAQTAGPANDRMAAR